MMGQAIAAQPIGHAGPRELPSEHGGPRPAAIRRSETAQLPREARVAAATRP